MNYRDENFSYNHSPAAAVKVSYAAPVTPVASYNIIDWNTAEINDNGAFDLANNRFNCLKAGRLRVDSYLSWVVGSGGVFLGGINQVRPGIGAINFWQFGQNNGVPSSFIIYSAVGFAVMDVSLGDYIEILAYVTTADAYFQAGANWATFYYLP